MVMIFGLKTPDFAKNMSRSVSVHTVLETGVSTVSVGVRLSGSGRRKTASQHLFNKVGSLVNQPTHSLIHSVLTHAAWASEARGANRCCFWGSFQALNSWIR